MGRRQEINPVRAIELHARMPWRAVARTLAAELGRGERFHDEAVKKVVRNYLKLTKGVSDEVSDVTAEGFSGK